MYLLSGNVLGQKEGVTDLALTWISMVTARDTAKMELEWCARAIHAKKMEMPSKAQKSAMGGQVEIVGERADGWQSGKSPDSYIRCWMEATGMEWRREVSKSGEWWLASMASMDVGHRMASMATMATMVLMVWLTSMTSKEAQEDTDVKAPLLLRSTNLPRQEKQQDPEVCDGRTKLKLMENELKDYHSGEETADSDSSD